MFPVFPTDATLSPLSHLYHLIITILSPESQSLAVELFLWLWNVSTLWSLHALPQSFVYLEGPPVRLSCIQLSILAGDGGGSRNGLPFWRKGTVMLKSKSRAEVAFQFSFILLYVRAPQTTICLFVFFFLGMVLIIASYTMSNLHHSS